jgi:hypothetical protein
MVEYGYTEAGFIPRPASVIRDQIAQALRDALGENFRTDDDEPQGQFISILSEQIATAEKLGESIDAAGRVGGANGAALDFLLGLTAISRRPASFSSVTLHLAGVDGTVVPAGAVVRDDQGNDWASVADSAAFAGGADVAFRAVSAGPLKALAGTVWTLRTVVLGWTGATNAGDAAPGRLAQKDAEARRLLQLSFRSGGGSSDETIRSVLLGLPGVTEALVISNRHWYPDEDGRPPKSFECVVRGGDDASIALAIWRAMAGGIEPVGDVPNTITDSQGDAQSVPFSRPIDVPIYLDWRYRPKSNAPTNLEALVRQALLNFGNSLHMGDDVEPWAFEQVVETAGMVEAGLRVGTSAGPTSTRPLVITRKQLATFDSTRITFTVF